MAQSRVEEAQRTGAPNTAPPPVRWLFYLDSAGDQAPHSALILRMHCLQNTGAVTRRARCAGAGGKASFAGGKASFADKIMRAVCAGQGGAAGANGSAQQADDGYYSDEEDHAAPEPEPDELGAPHFSEWPEQRGFMQVVKDKAGDTVQARSAACPYLALWIGYWGINLCMQWPPVCMRADFLD